MNYERNECVFYWQLENYSYCWYKNTEAIISPEFITDGLENTIWNLHLYPKGDREASKDFISVFLYRGKDNGPEKIPLKGELSLFEEDGPTLYSKEFKQTFEKDSTWGYPQFQRVDEVLILRSAEYLPKGTLSVRCKIRWGENIQSVTQIYARTRIGVQWISFLHVVENFSSIEANQKKTVQIRYSTKDKKVISSSVYFTNNVCCEEKIIVEITPSNTKQILLKCKFSLLDGTGIATKCGGEDILFEATRRDILQLPLSLTRKAILNRKGEFLHDDKLSVLCECVFSSGIKFQGVEKTLHEIPSMSLNQLINDDSDNESNAYEDLSDYPTALDDLEDIYKNQFLTDVKLKTETKSFPAHKIVLSARSPVFKAMMNNDMREKNTDCIKIEDLDDDTVQQLLLFLYSDKIEDLHWENATKLYYASDKYQVKKLKAECSNFLEDNLSTFTATELLLLADTHNDEELKEVVEDFILENEEEVFGSDEWEKLIETNPQLVIKTMHLKYRRKKCKS